MSFEARYPDTAGSGHSWLPSRAVSISGSEQKVHTGYIIQMAADQVTSYGYKVASEWREYSFAFSGLTTTDMDNLEAFISAVGADAFYVRDGSGSECGILTSYTKVKLTNDGHNLVRNPQAGQRWSTALHVRTSN